jgi:hypothetical protein
MRNRILFVILLAFSVGAMPAAAEPVHVTGGGFVIDLGLDIFTFEGDGFSLRTDPDPDPLQLIQSTKLFARGGGPQHIPPFAVESEGQLLDWGFKTAGGEQLLGRGEAVLGGTRTSNVDFVGSLRFNAVPTPLVSGGSLDFDYIAPFSFQAMIRGIRNGQELFARELAGRGRLSVNYEGSTRPGLFGFADESIHYDFTAADPVPEPATLVLLGSGLVFAALRGRRQTARRRYVYIGCRLLNRSQPFSTR